MANLFNYPSRAAYVADTSRPAQQSSVSYDGSETIVDGRNVILPFTPANCEVGDMVIYDTLENKKKILKWASYYAGTFDASRYIKSNAVFVGFQGRRALFFAVANAASAAQKWACACYFRLTGLDLTVDGSFTFKTYYSSAAHTDNVVSWTAGATLASVVTTMNSLGLNASYFKAAALADGTGIGVQVDYPTTATVSNIFSLTAQSGGAADAEVEYMNQYDGNDAVFQYMNTGSVIPGRKAATSSVLRRNGNVLSYGGAHYDKFYDYYKTNGSATFVAESTAAPMNKACFDALASSVVEAELALYNKYDGDYGKYIKAAMVSEETLRGVMGLWYDGEVEQTAILGQILTKDYDENVIPAFPACYYAYRFGVNTPGVTTGFEAGQWGSPTPWQIVKIIKQVGLNASNKTTLNLAIEKFNPSGTFYGNGSYFWTCAEYSDNFAFIYSGGNGNLGNYIKNGTLNSRALLALVFD